MRIVKAVSTTECVNSAVIDLLNVLARKINKYCNKILIDIGLYTKSTQLELIIFQRRGYLTSRASTSSASSLSKLKVYIHKYLLKNTPFISLGNTPLFNFSGVGDFGTITFKKILVGTGMTDKDWAGLEGLDKAPDPVDISNNLGLRINICEFLMKDDSTARYIRYLNYKIRKYRVPLVAVVDSKLAISSDSLSQIRNSIVEGTNYIKLSEIVFEITTTIRLKKFVWVPVVGPPSRVPMSSYSDSQMGDASNWKFTEIARSESTVDGPLHAEFPSANVFKYFKHGLKIINTLSRKNSYDSNAYSFRAV